MNRAAHKTTARIVARRRSSRVMAFGFVPGTDLAGLVVVVGVYNYYCSWRVNRLRFPLRNRSRRVTFDNGTDKSRRGTRIYCDVCVCVCVQRQRNAVNNRRVARSSQECRAYGGAQYCGRSRPPRGGRWWRWSRGAQVRAAAAVRIFAVMRTFARRRNGDRFAIYPRPRAITLLPSSSPIRFFYFSFYFTTRSSLVFSPSFIIPLAPRRHEIRRQRRAPHPALTTRAPPPARSMSSCAGTRRHEHGRSAFSRIRDDAKSETTFRS